MFVGIVIAAVILAAAILGIANRNLEESPFATPSLDQNIGTTALALIEHNKQFLASNAANPSLMEATKYWQEYKDPKAGFSIKYPADLIEMRYGEHYPFGVDEVKNEEGLFLERPIPFETYDACDLRGGPDVKPLTNIPDFELGIRVFRLPLRETMLMESFYEESDVDALLSGSTQVFGGLTAIGNDISTGPFKGIYEYRGFEYCGEGVYYVPIDSGVTLIVTEPFYLDSLLSVPLPKEQFEWYQVHSPLVKKFVEVQSQYPPIDREHLSNQILSTFRLLDK